MFATANLHNWYRFLKERLHPHAQYEIRVYAKAILSVLAELYPNATQSHFPEYFFEGKFVMPVKILT
jgi:thymidylate synthase (FAD)